MNNVTINIRTHRILLKDGREFAITSEQYSGIRIKREDAKRSDPFTLRDCDSGKILYDGEFGEIKEFIEVNNSPVSEYRYICDFGTRHALTTECDCSKKIFNNFPNIYVLPAMRYLGFKNCTTSSMITKDMKLKFYEATKNNTFIEKIREYYNNLIFKI